MHLYRAVKNAVLRPEIVETKPSSVLDRKNIPALREKVTVTSAQRSPLAVINIDVDMTCQHWERVPIVRAKGRVTSRQVWR